jgi:hypothetical protein
VKIVIFAYGIIFSSLLSLLSLFLKSILSIILFLSSSLIDPKAKETADARMQGYRGAEMLALWAGRRSCEGREERKGKEAVSSAKAPSRTKFSTL